MAADLKANGVKRRLAVEPDVTDLRDRCYEPALVSLSQRVVPMIGAEYIRNQQGEGACTGFALAAVLDQQCRKLFGVPDMDGKNQSCEQVTVSARMLYEMARIHDDYPGTKHSGSTVRGAVKGFYHNGVCREADAPFWSDDGIKTGNGNGWRLSRTLADRARNISLGAYYRLNQEINDYHTAINEAGAILVSARIHTGWANPDNGIIELVKRHEGHHAFAVVGYNEEGFIIQNSWGKRWGRYNGMPGLALWKYEDWAENVTDAWVLRLAISSPTAFNIKYAKSHTLLKDAKAARSAFAPRRQEILGHFLHFDDGDLVSDGRFATPMDEIAETASEIAHQAASNKPKIKHVLFFAHGALQNRLDVAYRIKAWRRVFERNGIYPIHLMWETGFNNEVVNVIQDLLFKTQQRMGGTEEHRDEYLEQIARPLGRKLWRDLKESARLTFAHGTETRTAFESLVNATRVHEKQQFQLHFASQSAGALLFGEMFDALPDGLRLSSGTMMAPACSVSFFNEKIRPELGRRVDRIVQLGLTDTREKADSLDIYSKSLLYLVSNAIEHRCREPLLGLECFFPPTDPQTRKIVPLDAGHDLWLAGRDKTKSDSKSHRGFDSDRKSMNSLLKAILGPGMNTKLGFKEAELSGY